MSKKELVEMIFHHFYNGPTYAYECFPPIDFTIIKNGIKYNGSVCRIQQYGDEWDNPRILCNVTNSVITDENGNSILLKTLNSSNVPTAVLEKFYNDYVKTHNNYWTI